MTALRGALAGLTVSVLTVACANPAAPAKPYDQTHSASQIASDAGKSLKSVKAAHVKFTGSSTSSGQVGVDADVQGQDINGTLSVGGQSLKVVSVGGKVYVYGPDLLNVVPISDPATAANVKALVGTNWVVIPNSSSVTGNLSSAFDFSSIGDCITGMTGLKKNGTSKIDGDQVVELDDSSGSQIFVLTAAPHYPRRLILSSATTCSSASSGSGSGTLDLTRVGQHFAITAPTNTVDLSSLGVLGG